MKLALLAVKLPDGISDCSVAGGTFGFDNTF